MLQGKLHVFCCPFFRTFGSPNPDPISDQKIVIFHTRFQTSRFQTWRRQKLCYHFEFAIIYYSFFLIHLELKRKNTFMNYRVPSKTANRAAHTYKVRKCKGVASGLLMSTWNYNALLYSMNTCPHCGTETYPIFMWRSTFKIDATQLRRNRVKITVLMPWTETLSGQPRSQSSSAISDVTSPVKPPLVWSLG